MYLLKCIDLYVNVLYSFYVPTSGQKRKLLTLQGGNKMKYENRRNGSIGTIVEENEKSKTVILELEDGKTVSISTSTLKRWWKKVKEEEAEVVEPLIDLDNPITDEESEELGMIDGEKALEMEETAGDGTPLEEVGKEIAEQAKQKSKKALKKESSKKYKFTREDIPNMIKSLQNKLDSSEEIKTRTISKVPGFLAVKKNGKSVLEVRIHRTGKIIISCKTGKAPDVYSVSNWNNYYLPEHFECGESDYVNAISEIIENS